MNPAAEKELGVIEDGRLVCPERKLNRNGADAKLIFCTAFTALPQ